MTKQDVIAFFDELAPTWDADMVRSDAVIGQILDRGGVLPGKRVLDVACGTGVLFPDYLARNVKSVTGVDISPKMAEIASEKYPNEPRVQVICADVQALETAQCFDCIMIYNAFPHFPEPEALLEKLSRMLAPGGRLTVAHGMSREKIDAHHHGCASRVSVGLLPEDALASMMGKWLRVDTVISDTEKYIVSGKLPDGN